MARSFIKLSVSLVVVLEDSFFFFQAEDGIRDLVRSRGLGDVYKRQTLFKSKYIVVKKHDILSFVQLISCISCCKYSILFLSLIHI